MALAMQHRIAIQENLSPVVGVDATEALLAQFPVRESDEPATKEFVHAEVATVRAEVVERLAHTDTKVAEFRADTLGRLAKTSMETAELRAEVREGLANASKETADLRTEVRAGFAQASKDLGVGLANAGKETADLRTEVRTGRARSSKELQVGLRNASKETADGLAAVRKEVSDLSERVTALKDDLTRRGTYGLILAASAVSLLDKIWD